MNLFKKHIVGNDIVSVLKIPPFAYMMLSEFFGQLAFNMQNFVLIFLIYQLTESNTAVSILVLSFTLPAIAFSLVCGAYVDRWNKKSVLFYTNIARGILLIPLLLFGFHLGLIYVLSFLIAIATQFFLPAESAIIPSLVPKKLILSANAVFSLGIYSTIFAGYILAGPILLLLGKTNAIAVLIFLFFVSTLFILGIKVAKKESIGKPQFGGATLGVSLYKEIREVFRFIRAARKVTQSLIVLTIAQAVIFTFAVLGPGYVATVLHVQIESLSLILIAPAGVGLVFGAFFLGSIGKKHKAKSLGLVGFITAGLTFILFPSVKNFLPQVFDTLYVVIFLAGIVGFAISLIFVPSHATIQMETDDTLRGRIYGLLNALIGAVSFLPVIIAGGLADVLGVGIVITLIGVLIIIVSVAIYSLK